MTLPEAMVAHAAWLGIWLNVLMLGLFIAPAAMLIWPESRKLGVLGLIAGVLSALMIDILFKSGGYTRLLGISHIIFLTPFAWLMWKNLKRTDLRVWPRRVIVFSFTITCISLIFDSVDVLRYLFGERSVIAG